MACPTVWKVKLSPHAATSGPNRRNQSLANYNSEAGFSGPKPETYNLRFGPVFGKTWHRYPSRSTGAPDLQYSRGYAPELLNTEPNLAFAKPAALQKQDSTPKSGDSTHRSVDLGLARKMPKVNPGIPSRSHAQGSRTGMVKVYLEVCTAWSNCANPISPHQRLRATSYGTTALGEPVLRTKKKGGSHPAAHARAFKPTTVVGLEKAVRHCGPKAFQSWAGGGSRNP